MRQLVLHVGVHRTATSSVQSYLSANAEQIQRQGFLYPAYHPMARRQLGLFRAVFDHSISVKKMAEIIDQEADQAPQQIHTIVLSDEDVCTQRMSVLGELSKSFSVTVVISLRRQDTWLESWYLQNIKWQWNPRYAHLPFDDFLERREDFHWVHYDRTLRQISETFGAESVKPMIFERTRMPEGPVAAFRTAIGLAHTDEMVPPRQINQRFSSETSEFLRQLPLGNLGEGRRATVEGAIQRVGEATSPRTNTHLLTYPQRLAILEDYQEGNRAVAERYFGTGELFAEEIPTEPPAPMVLPDSDELMRRYVGPLILELSPFLMAKPNPDGAPRTRVIAVEPQKGMRWRRPRRLAHRVLRRAGWSVRRV